jgi:hypothetical protein
VAAARPTGSTRGRSAVARARGAPVAPGVTAVASPEARAVRIAALEWRDFAADVDACVACGLSRTRKKTVPGVGDVRAEWLFVGEAPGAEEDAKGEPFVGQAGKLLDNMLAALGMNRGKSVYIANVLKCRPPGNRTPSRAKSMPAARTSTGRSRSCAEGDRRSGQERRDHAPRDRRHDRKPRGRVHRYGGRPARGHVPSGLPASQPA